MESEIGTVSWVAVIIGAVVAFLVGWLWYSPKLFGEKWAEGVGVSLGSADQMPVAAMVAQIVGMILMSWVIGITAAQNALFTAILVILAITALIIANGYFARKSPYAIRTEAGFIIVAGIIMIACQGIF